LGEIFRTCPERPGGSLSLLCALVTGSFPGVKRRERCVDDPPSSTEIKEGVELFLYSPSGTSLPLFG